MPESKSRKKPSYTPPPEPAAPKANPSWWAPTMLTLMILGLVWVVTTYIWQSGGPIPGIGSWNLAVGFGLMMIGFVMTMRWR
ncbi:cell division protein CrgA [Ruania rhizosphaerae]|uniref:cell division protein CrgA n=1 Tax=Ruania rhizosphaerae TaxID=1840413 RepID=UPI00135C5828|nr:cell division protein CrgA [Ruania rhizosphaerae]